MKEVDVLEYGQVRHLALEHNQRDAILACGGVLTLTPEPGTDSLWCLRAGSYVGTVSLPGMILRIRPKLSIARLFVMISAAAGAIQWDERSVGLAQSSAVEDVLAMALVDSVRRGLATGLLRGYVSIEEESFVVRGRLDLTQTLRRRPVTLAPLVQTPEFLDEDTPENRVLATALSHLAKRVSSPVVRSRVVDCQRAFAGVQCLPSGSPLPRLQRHRLNARWWGALELAMLVLNACGLDLPSGQHLSRSFLIDMNVVFERFVHRALADELRRWGHDLQHNRGGLYLDEDECHGLRPDLSVWAGAMCRFAGDCKYKYTDDGNARRDDIYQCLAYSAATGLPRITLIYGGGPVAARDVEIVGGRPMIRVRVLNLAARPDQLQTQFGAIAMEIAHDL